MATGWSRCKSAAPPCALLVLVAAFAASIQAAEPLPPSARQQAIPQTAGREMVGRLVDLQAGQVEIRERLVKVETRLDGVEKRLDELRVDTNRRFEEQRGFLLWGFGILFAGMMSLIGFVLWDRRSAMAPAIRRTDDLAERQVRVERALHELAAQDAKVAEILRHVGLR